MPVSRKRKKTAVRAAVQSAQSQSASVLRPAQWSALRAARRVVMDRDDLLGWLDVSHDTPARTMMRMDFAARLAAWYPSNADEFRRVVAHDFAIDLAAADGVTEFVDAWARSRRARLSSAPLYVLTEEMMNVCLSAAATLTVEDVAEYVRSGDNVHAAGHLLLPDNLLTSNPLSSIEVDDLRALSWFPSTYGVRAIHPDDRLPPVGQVHHAPTTRILAWSSTFGGLAPQSHRDFLTMAERLGVRVPSLVFGGESWAMTDPADEQARREAFATLGDRPVVGTQEVISQHLPGAVVEDPDGSLTMRFLMAFWRLCDQEIAEVTPQETQTRGERPARPKRWEKVNVVTLRRRRRPRDPDRETQPVAWSCRWVVQMHRVRQWYPSEGRHKVIFRGPFFKGPEGAPLKPTAEQVKALAR